MSVMVPPNNGQVRACFGVSPCSVIEHPQHRDNAVGVAIGAPDVASDGTNVVDGKPDAPSGLGDAGALLQGVIDALDAVILHANEEAGGQLRSRRARVEQCGRGVCEPAL